jgi:hypothetical protein
MGFRFEFDSATRILLLRVEGRLSDELLAECYEAIRKYSTATNASAGIFDMSAVTEFAVSSECIRRLAGREPAMPYATSRLRIIAVEGAFGFGLARMFQLTRGAHPTNASSCPYAGRGVESARCSIATL